MADYGVVPEGFARKPLSEILKEVEQANITEFGPNVIQSAQSPLGQINGLFANLVAQLWEMGEDVYQSYDPDQAEGTRLETLAKMRLLRRAVGEQDPAFRIAITNQGRARIDIPDIARAVAGIEGVTYSQVWLNDTGETDTNLLPRNSVCLAVLGGDDFEIADALRNYIVPGVSTYGNHVITTNTDGYCRSLLILRPIIVPAKIEIHVRMRNDSFGCPPPSTTAIRYGLAEELTSGTRRLLNGDSINAYRVRSIIESKYENVEFVRMRGWRDGNVVGSEVAIAFIELATITADDITVEIVPQGR